MLAGTLLFPRTVCHEQSSGCSPPAAAARSRPGVSTTGRGALRSHTLPVSAVAYGTDCRCRTALCVQALMGACVVVHICLCPGSMCRNSRVSPDAAHRSSDGGWGLFWGGCRDVADETRMGGARDADDAGGGDRAGECIQRVPDGPERGRSEGQKISAPARYCFCSLEVKETRPCLAVTAGKTWRNPKVISNKF